jgi:chromosome segregation ATPase
MGVRRWQAEKLKLYDDDMNLLQHCDYAIVALWADHRATVSRLERERDEARRECEAAKEKLHDEVIACTGDYDTLADERDSLSTALAAERERAGRMEAELEEVSPMTPCARCGKRFRQHTMTWEEGDELECFECNARCNAEERAALAPAGEGEKNG